MKLISFRVTVAADSDALVGEVQTRLRALVEAAGIEPIRRNLAAGILADRRGRAGP
jgi:hypothetical protein